MIYQTKKALCCISFIVGSMLSLAGFSNSAVSQTMPADASSDASKPIETELSAYSMAVCLTTTKDKDLQDDGKAWMQLIENRHPELKGELFSSLKQKIVSLTTGILPVDLNEDEHGAPHPLPVFTCLKISEDPKTQSAIQDLSKDLSGH